MLEPLACLSCGSQVPLSEASVATCPACEAEVQVSRRHTGALRDAREGKAARAKVAERMAELANEPASETGLFAAGVMVLLPSISVWFVVASLEDIVLSQFELFVLVAFPALVPGVLLWVRSAVTRSTSARHCSAMVAAPTVEQTGRRGCRSCWAVLPGDTDAAAVRCAYCQTDNLLRDVPVDAFDRALGSTLRTFEEAVGLLRQRRAVWMLGVAALCAVGLALIAIAHFAAGGGDAPRPERGHRAEVGVGVGQ